jgi:hypothetical protein
MSWPWHKALFRALFKRRQGLLLCCIRPRRLSRNIQGTPRASDKARGSSHRAQPYPDDVYQRWARLSHSPKRAFAHARARDSLPGSARKRPLSTDAEDRYPRSCRELNSLLATLRTTVDQGTWHPTEGTSACDMLVISQLSAATEVDKVDVPRDGDMSLAAGDCRLATVVTACFQ